MGVEVSFSTMCSGYRACVYARPVFYVVGFMRAGI
jgi:hypothetical protein